MDAQEPKRRGRPPKPPEERKGGNLTFRTRADLRERLEEAAKQSGRTVTEEVELRVERSFDNDRNIRLLDNLMSVFIDHGPAARDFASTLMALIASIHEQKASDGHQIGSEDWESSLPTKAALRVGFKILIDKYAPKIEDDLYITLPEKEKEDIDRARAMATITAKMYTGQADDLVRMVMRHDAAGED